MDTWKQTNKWPAAAPHTPGLLEEKSISWGIEQLHWEQAQTQGKSFSSPPDIPSLALAFMASSIQCCLLAWEMSAPRKGILFKKVLF